MVHATETGRDLVRALLAGVAGWVAVSIGWLVWLFSTSAELGLFAVAAPFWAWSIGYLPGAAVLFVYCVVQALRRRLAVRAAAWALAIYLLPVVVLQGAFRLFLAGQPTSVSQGDDAMMIAAFGAPLFAALYVLGLILGFAARHRPLRSTVLAFLIPPVAGVVLAGCFFTVYTLGSSHWQTRADYVLHVQKIDWRLPRGLSVEAELEVKRDVTAVFHAFYQDRNGRGEPVRSLAIGAPVPSSEPQAWTRMPRELRAGQRYPVRMEWPQLDTTSSHSSREVFLRVVEGRDYHSGRLLREFKVAVDPTEPQMAALESRLRPQGPTGRVGYATPSGKVVIPGRFEWADEFSEGLALVRLGGRFGFIDTSGKLVIDARYSMASRFSEGMAAVAETREGYRRAGYIDRSGATAIPFAFEATHPFSGGLARVRQGGREGYIDRSGRFVIAPQWDEAYDFAAGLAPVKVGERWGFIDPSGAIVLEPQFQALQPFQAGRWNVMRDGRWGPVDRSGRWLPE